MALALLTQNYGSAYAGYKVYVKSSTGSPARLFATASGGEIPTNGVATLDGSGVLNVYADDALTYTYSLLDVPRQETLTSLSGVDADLGAPAEGAAASDTATAGIIPLIKRGLQNWTSLFTRLPVSLGAKTAAASISVVQASDGVTIAGGITNPITTALTITANSAYSTGNVLGGLMTIANMARVAGGSGLVQSTVANCKTNQTVSIDVIYFNANPSSSTFTDKTAFSVAAADFNKVIGVAHITDWTNLGTPSTGQAQNQAMPFKLASGTTGYAVAVVRGNPTFSFTDGVSITHGVTQD